MKKIDDMDYLTDIWIGIILMIIFLSTMAAGLHSLSLWLIIPLFFARFLWVIFMIPYILILMLFIMSWPVLILAAPFIILVMLTS